jgi:5-methylcytosine-specific restriction endonuclease McrA
MKSQRKMPTKTQVKAHWAEWLVDNDKFDCISEVLENDYCFACGMNWRLSAGDPNAERAHIKPRHHGGSDAVENIHLLCRCCHRDSEVFFDAMNSAEAERYYFAWLKNRSAANVLMRWSINPSASPAPS